MEITKETKLAKFYNENDKLKCSLNIDYTDFKIKSSSFYDGDEDYTKEEYDAIYEEVSNNCNDYGTHSIYCENGYFVVKKINDVIPSAEEQIAIIKQKFYDQIEAPVEYSNGLKYRLRYKDQLTMLYYQMFDDADTVRVYDITNTEKNSRNMTKSELKDLIIFLRDRYEYYYSEMMASSNDCISSL